MYQNYKQTEYFSHFPYALHFCTFIVFRCGRKFKAQIQTTVSHFLIAYKWHFPFVMTIVNP